MALQNAEPFVLYRGISRLIIRLSHFHTSQICTDMISYIHHTVILVHGDETVDIGNRGELQDGFSPPEKGRFRKSGSSFLFRCDMV